MLMCSRTLSSSRRDVVVLLELARFRMSCQACAGRPGRRRGSAAAATARCRPARVQNRARHRQGVQPTRPQLDLLVFEQRRTSSARGSSASSPSADLGRQQHPRLDLDQHRGHEHVFGRQFELVCGSRRHTPGTGGSRSASGMSRMLKFCRRIRYSSRSSGPRTPRGTSPALRAECKDPSAARTTARHRAGRPRPVDHHRPDRRPRRLSAGKDNSSIPVTDGRIRPKWRSNAARRPSSVQQNRRVKRRAASVRLGLVDVGLLGNPHLRGVRPRIEVDPLVPTAARAPGAARPRASAAWLSCPR